MWECIKTEGKHLGSSVISKLKFLLTNNQNRTTPSFPVTGTCVDGFLFGSCCTHNETLNQLDSGGSTPVKPYYSNSISAAYHSEHEPSYTTNLDLASSPNSNLTSYVNFNNNPPSDNDVYHIHHEYGSSPVQSMASTTSSVPSINLSFLPASSGSTASVSPSSLPSSSNYHHNLNQPHYLHQNRPTSGGPFNNGFNNLDNDDHRRPHTHNQHSNHSGAHFHHHNYENFLMTTNGDKSSAGSAQPTTAKPSVPSFINFNLTNPQSHPLGSSSLKPNYKPTSFQQHPYSTTILPPIVMNYNPFKPANHTFLMKNNSTSLALSNGIGTKPGNSSTFPQAVANNPAKPAHSSAWNSFYKPWSNKPTNGKFSFSLSLQRICESCSTAQINLSN